VRLFVALAVAANLLDFFWWLREALPGILQIVAP